MNVHSIPDVESLALKYEYVTSEKRAWELLEGLDNSIHALDFETTALHPSDGEVRLSSISGPGNHNFIIDHFYAGKFKTYADFMSERSWAVFNAMFEGMWIDEYACEQKVDLLDVQFMRAAKMGGNPMMKLAVLAKWDLGITLVKDEQNSNWSNPVLSKSQLDYAILDAVATYHIWGKWNTELTAAQHHGFRVINDSWRGTLEMQDTGLYLDVPYHTGLVKWWEIKKETARKYLRKWTSNVDIPNLNSNQQISNFLKLEYDPQTIKNWPRTEKTKTDQLDLTRDTLKQAAFRSPYPINRWLAALIIYRKQSKYLSTYGEKLITSQKLMGKVRTRFNIARATTGRYSSSAHNLQNIPNSPIVRRSFVTKIDEEPSEHGEVVLIIADYSSIEVRVLAELAGDATLLYDAIYGDVHSRSASQIFRIDADYFYEVIHSDDPKYDNVRPQFSAMRRRAKAFTFQLLYGAGYGALAVALKCTDDEAIAAIEAWASVYPKAYHYRQIMFEEMMATGFLPVVDGRTIFVPKNKRDMPVAANYPVQGAAASVMYCAVKRLHTALYERPTLPARMAATVHDELLMFSRRKAAQESAGILVDSMVTGWLDVFPHTDTNNLVGSGNKATIGYSWADKK